VGRALLLRPKVLLIDEPSIGLSPLVVQDVFRLLRKLADEQGVTVLMVEQNVKSALKMADEAIALESGRLVLHRDADELLADPNIERLFLGGAHAAAQAPQLPRRDADLARIARHRPAVAEVRVEQRTEALHMHGLARAQLAGHADAAGCHAGDLHHQRRQQRHTGRRLADAAGAHLARDGVEQRHQRSAVPAAPVHRQHGRLAHMAPQFGRQRVEQGLQRSLGRGDDRTVDVAAKAESVHAQGRHHHQAGRLQHPPPVADHGLAAALLDVEHLKHRVVDVRLDLPVEQARSLRDALAVDKVDAAGRRRVAVE
jgi:hypothetical protein